MCSLFYLLLVQILALLHQPIVFVKDLLKLGALRSVAQHDLVFVIVVQSGQRFVRQLEVATLDILHVQPPLDVARLIGQLVVENVEEGFEELIEGVSEHDQSAVVGLCVNMG